MKDLPGDTTYSQVPPPARCTAVVMAEGRPLHQWLVHVARGLGILAALAGATVFAGWMLGIAPLRDLSGAIIMKTNTALGLLLAGTGLVLLIPAQTGRGRRWAGRICATIVLLFGALTFSEHLLGWNLGIDQLLASEAPGAAGAVSPNRMGPLTCLTFFLLGPALLLLGRQEKRAGRRALDQSFALLVVLAALLPTIGYLYGANELFGAARYTGIAWPTAAALLALGLGLLCARPQEGLMAAVTADDPGGRTIRFLLVPMILLPLMMGWLRLAGEYHGLYESALGTSLLTLAYIVIFSALVYYAGRRVSQSAAVSEQQRQLLRESQQRQEVTEAVQAERQRLNNVLDMLPAYVVLLTPDYHVPFANRFFEERFGKSNGKRCFDYLFNRSEPCENCETYKVLKTGAPQRWEWTGPDGRNYDIHDFPFTDPDGSPLIMEMGLDITERKRAEAAVLAERRRLFDVLETLPAMVCLLTPDYHVAFANRGFREKFGESHGRRCYEYCFGRSEPCEFCESFQVLKTGQPHHWEVTGADGTVIAAHDFPFTDVDGSPLILEMDMDITEQRKAEAALKEVNESLEQRVAERTAALAESEQHIRASLAEKEVLLKEIHHRVKNNMQVISSLVDLQADQLQDDAMRAVLQDVTHRVRSMALVHEKLYQSADMSRVEFAEYAQSLLGYLWRAHGTAASGVRLTLDLEPVPLSVNAAVPCGLILNELASNALKHAFRGRDGGEVIVSLRGGPGRRTCLRVRDNGIGLRAGLDWRQSDSLGLRLVQILAKQLSATVEVQGSQGTEFSVSFGGPTP
jgi:two-component sensor histidine kinase